MINMEIKQNFFVIEGLDGAGTTTQRNMIRERAEKPGLPVIATAEPTDNPAGKLIRSILTREISMHPETLAYLFAADRHEHLHGIEGIIPALARGMIVASDRYLFSSLAYQSLSVDFDTVAAINSRFPLPEAVFFIDTPPEVCEARRKGRGNEELFDAIALQRRVRDAYLKAFALFRESSMETIVIDGTLSPEKIHDVIWKRLKVMPIV